MKYSRLTVTLRVRVWIETMYINSVYFTGTVTLRVRVWIETRRATWPGWEKAVTLRVRVWIETSVFMWSTSRHLSHPPREGVD